MRPGDLIEIADIIKYFKEKGTIEEDLVNITATDKTIMAFHQPPYGLGLDVCHDGRKTGSKAIFDWIKKTQPLCVLSGHIHESYDVTGIWKASIDKAIVIQPSQYLNASRTQAVLITLEKNVVEAELLTLK